MNLGLRDRAVLEKMIQLCGEADEMLALCGGTKAGWEKDKICRDALTMCTIWIGALAERLSEKARQETDGIAWDAIRRMQNMPEDDEFSIDYEKIWTIVTEDLPRLQGALEGYLERI